MKQFTLIMMASMLLPFIANAQSLIPEQTTIHQNAHVFTPILEIAVSFDGGVTVKDNTVAHIYASNGEIIASATLVANNHVASKRTQGWAIATFDNPLILPKGESYRFVIAPYVISADNDTQIVNSEIAIDFDVPATIGAGHPQEIDPIDKKTNLFCFYWPTEIAAVGTDNVAILYREGEPIGEYPFNVSWDWNLGQASVKFGGQMNFDKDVNYSLVIPAGTISALYRPDIVNEETSINFIGDYESSMPFSDTTGISPITSSPNNTLYNLQGQQLSTCPARGLYIINGKKIITQ